MGNNAVKNMLIMKKMFLIFGFSIFCLNLFSQEEKLEKDSLPVYVIIDEYVAAIIDSFMIDVQSINYHSIDYFIYFELFDNGNLSLIVDSRKKKNLSDSIVLYKHPNCFQVFLQHSGRLIETTICKYPNFDCKDCYPDEILKDTGLKQSIYYDEIPEDFFRDNPVKGEIPYEDELTGWLYDYYDGEWHEAIKIYHTDNY
jgi:hypothetical protein